MVVWFLAIAALGLRGIWREPAVLRALDPLEAVSFITRQPWVAFVSLGAVVLCITGVEALYADMGHFGRMPIAAAWLLVVLPRLTLCYFGQGALILEDPARSRTRSSSSRRMRCWCRSWCSRRSRPSSPRKP